jgi:hypothetical protein
MSRFVLLMLFIITHEVYVIYLKHCLLIQLALLHSLSTMSVITNYIFPIKLFSGINFLFCNPE